MDKRHLLGAVLATGAAPAFAAHLAADGGRWRRSRWRSALALALGLEVMA